MVFENPFDPRIGKYMLLWTTYVTVHAWPLIAVAFVIGSIPFGLVISRAFYEIDIRSAGSGNRGAKNALRTLGRGAGITVLLLDALKGSTATILPWLAYDRWHLARYPYRIDDPWHLSPHVIYCWIGMRLCDSPTWILASLCALAAIAGHCYSPWLRFKGGKGIATFLGVLCIAWWPSAIAFVIVWLALVLATGFASLGSMAGAIAASAPIAALSGSASLYFSIPAVAIVIWKHREDIARLHAGTESRLDLVDRVFEREASESHDIFDDGS